MKELPKEQIEKNPSNDYDEFLEDLEEDKDYRSAINIYRGMSHLHICGGSNFEQYHMNVNDDCFYFFRVVNTRRVLDSKVLRQLNKII